jgi:hypothetical protein
MQSSGGLSIYPYRNLTIPKSRNLSKNNSTNKFDTALVQAVVHGFPLSSFIRYYRLIALELGGKEE